MSIPIILAIDEGTTNAKAIAVDAEGRILSKAAKPLTLQHPQPGWAQQEPQEIWQAVRQAISQCLAALPDARVAGVAISNQRESVLIWQRASGEPLTPIVSWQCRRSQDFCRQLEQGNHADFIAYATGLPIDPLFPAARFTPPASGTEERRFACACREQSAYAREGWICFSTLRR